MEGVNRDPVRFAPALRGVAREIIFVARHRSGETCVLRAVDEAAARAWLADPRGYKPMWRVGCYDLQVFPSDAPAMHLEAAPGAQVTLAADGETAPNSLLRGSGGELTRLECLRIAAAGAKARDADEIIEAAEKMDRWVRVGG